MGGPLVGALVWGPFGAGRRGPPEGRDGWQLEGEAGAMRSPQTMPAFTTPQRSRQQPTWHLRSVLPSSTPATTVAQAPVPQASVRPAPRSHTCMRTWLGVSTSTNSARADEEPQGGEMVGEQGEQGTGLQPGSQTPCCARPTPF